MRSRKQRRKPELEKSKIYKCDVFLLQIDRSKKMNKADEPGSPASNNGKNITRKLTEILILKKSGIPVQDL
jgi:hypothetical protein